MNRKLLISLGIVLVLLALIFIKKWKPGSSLPELAKLTTAADEISIKADGYSVKLAKRDGKWFLSDKGFPADAEVVSDFEKKLSELKLLDLISEKGYFDNYDLTPEKGVEVAVSGAGKQLRKVMIGKQGLTDNHVYVRVDDSKEVYLASGITAAEFRPEIDVLREKKIFDVKGDAVISFSIKYMGKEYTFVKKKAEDKKADDKKTPDAETAVWICRGYESTEISSSLISNILFSFAPLRASTFPESPDKGNLICTVKLKTSEKEYELNIYSKKDKEMYYASSPESPYLFTVGGWQTEKYFIKNIKGLEKKK